MSPHVMYGSAVCEHILGLSRGNVLHIYIYAGALQYTMLVFWVLFSLDVSQNEEDTMQLYLMKITVYYNSLSLLLQYHKLYINTHLSV